MSWFQDAFLWPQLLTSGKGRDQLKNDIKYGEGSAKVGNPLHGLTAGYKVHELMSPTVHINDRIQDIKKNGFDSDHLKWAVKDQNHNLQDAFKENIPALAMFLAGGAGGGLGGGGGGAAAGGGAASAAPAASGGLGSFMPGSAAGAGLEGVTVVGSGGAGMSAGTEAAMAAAGASAAGSQGGNGESWWDKIKDQMGQGMGGQQQQPQQQQMPPARQGLGRPPSFMDKVKSGLFPVDSRAADAMGPEALAQQRNQALMRMGLGMMSASNQGAGLGESALFGLNTAQQSLDGALQRGYETARESRQEQRQSERDQVADQRYEREFEFENKRADRTDERDQRNFDRQIALDERALQWRGQDIQRDDAQFDRRMRVAEDRRESGQQPPSGYRWSAKGDLEPIPGGPADPSNKTGNFQEAERTAAFLGTRVANGLRTLKDIPQEDQTPGVMERMAEAAGSETGANMLRSEDRQRANAAQRDVLDAALTLATGAAYTQEQIEAARVSHFPQIGDSDVVKADKKARLETLLEAAKVKAGRAAGAIDEVLGKSAGATGSWQIEEIE